MESISGGWRDYKKKRIIESQSPNISRSMCSTYQEVRNFIRQGKLNKAINCALKLAQQNNHTNSLIELDLFSSRYQKNESEQRMGIITGSEYNSEYSKLVVSVLSLIGKMEIEEEREATENTNDSQNTSSIEGNNKYVFQGFSGSDINIGGHSSSDKIEEHPPINILFMAAQPDDQYRLQSEFDKIRQKVKSTIKRKVLHFYLPTWDTDYDKLLTRLQEDKPNVLHYSGHGTVDGMGLINNVDRNTQLIENYELEDIFEGRGKYLQLVFLNSCFSSSQAKIISEQGMYVLGINNKKIANELAVALAERFYLGFTTQDPPINLKKAIRRGCTNFARSYPAYADFISLWKDGQEISYKTFKTKEQ